MKSLYKLMKIRWFLRRIASDFHFVRIHSLPHTDMPYDPRPQTEDPDVRVSNYLSILYSIFNKERTDFPDEVKYNKPYSQKRIADQGR